MTLQAGILKKPVTIYQRVSSQDASGQPLEQYVLIASARAKIKELVGKDYEAAHQVVSEITHDVTIRYNGRVRAKQELRYAPRRVLEIVAVLDPDGCKNWMYLKCKEVGV
jgi:SPP1 family predicted phage head-tail adaptor